MPNRLDNNPKYFCFCRNVHVKELALGLAWFRIIIAAILILFALYQRLFSSNEIELSLPGKNKGSDQQLLIKGNALFLDGLIFEGVFILVISALVVYGDRKKKPWAYLPQLILDGIRLIGTVFGAIILAFLGVWLHQNESHINRMLKDLERNNFYEKPFEKHHYSLGGQLQNEKASEMPSISSLLTVPLLIFIVFWMILQIFTWVVTFRAYQYMRELTSTAPVVKMEEYRAVNDKLESQ